MGRISKEFMKGIFRENPIFVLCLGLCPALATSSSVKNAVGMGLSTTVVLLASNVTIAMLVGLLKMFGEAFF